MNKHPVEHLTCSSPSPSSVTLASSSRYQELGWIEDPSKVVTIVLICRLLDQKHFSNCSLGTVGNKRAKIPGNVWFRCDGKVSVSTGHKAAYHKNFSPFVQVRRTRDYCLTPESRESCYGHRISFPLHMDMDKQNYRKERKLWFVRNFYTLHFFSGNKRGQWVCYLSECVTHSHTLNRWRQK